MRIDEIEADYWAHHYFANPTNDSFEADDWDTDSILDAMENGEWEELINERN